MRVKYLAQEHNEVSRPGLEPGPFDPESSTLTVRPPCLPRFHVLYQYGHFTVKLFLYQSGIINTKFSSTFFTSLPVHLLLRYFFASVFIV